MGYPGFLERGFICINYFNFIGYLKTGVRRGFKQTPRTSSGSATGRLEFAQPGQILHC